MFLVKKTSEPQPDGLESSLFRMLHLLLEVCASSAVEFNSDEHARFRLSMHSIARRLEEVSDHQEVLILAGEANKTIQSYNQLVERFIHELSHEKQQAVQLLTQSLVHVCRANDKSTQNLRQIERSLAAASQLEDMREIRIKMSECVAALCLEADVQDAQYRELKDRIAISGHQLEMRDHVTGLGTLKSAEARMKELSAEGIHGFASTYFLRNLEVVNRRFGFGAGDEALRNFASFLKRHLQGGDQLFRWRGPCFVVVIDRLSTLEEIQSEARKLGLRGHEHEVEGQGKCMLIKMTAATTVFPIQKGRDTSEISAKIDEFASEQFKMTVPSQ